jgi:hypothetical protein
MYEEMRWPDCNDRGDDKHEDRDHPKRGAPLIHPSTETGSPVLMLRWPIVAVWPYVTPDVILAGQRDRRRGVQRFIWRIDHCAALARLW